MAAGNGPTRLPNGWRPAVGAALHHNRLGEFIMARPTAPKPDPFRLDRAGREGPLIRGRSIAPGSLFPAFLDLNRRNMF